MICIRFPIHHIISNLFFAKSYRRRLPYRYRPFIIYFFDE